MPIPVLAAMAGRMLGGAVGAEAGAGKVATTGARLAAAKDDGASAGTLARLKRYSNEAIAAQNKLSDSYSKVGMSAGLATGMVQGLAGGISGHFVGSLTMAATALKAFTDPIAELVQLANPASVEMFNWAFKDALAVIGRALLPIMQSLTKAMRTVGDNFARLEPIILDVSKFMGVLLDELFADLNSLWSKNGPPIELLADAFKTLADVAGLAAHVVLSVASALMAMSKPLLNMLGYGGKEKKGASAFGAAVRNVSIGTSGEDISRQAQAKAFSQLVNTPGKKTQEDVPGLLDRIVTFLEENLTIVKIGKAIYDALPGAKDVPGGETVKSGANTAADNSPLLNFFRSMVTR